MKRTYKNSKEKILKPYDDLRGYFRVGLCSGGKRKKFRVHRLVAEAFIPNPENKPCINHKDGNKHNNKKDNLEFCTYSENLEHAWKYGLRKARRSKNQ